jgi:hypothetical protein
MRLMGQEIRYFTYDRTIQVVDMDVNQKEHKDERYLYNKPTGCNICPPFSE